MASARPGAPAPHHRLARMIARVIGLLYYLAFACFIFLPFGGIAAPLAAGRRIAPVFGPIAPARFEGRLLVGVPVAVPDLFDLVGTASIE